VLAHARALLTSDPHSALILRTKAEVTAMFNSLELVPPGVAQLDRWLPGAPALATDAVGITAYGALRRKL
jgi:hypothetical protein